MRDWSRWEILAFAVCVLALLVPLFAAADLPLVDLPRNLALTANWNHFDDARYGLAKYYTLHLPPVPYLAFHAFLHVVSFVMPLRWANKLFMALTIVGFALALAAFLRASGKPRLLALAVLPIYWGRLTEWGWLNSVAGFALLVYGWALLARLAAEPTRRRTVGNAALGFGLYLLHPMAWAMWLPAVAVYLWRRWRHALIIVAPSAMCLVLGVVFRGGGVGGRNPNAPFAHWEPIGTLILDVLPRYFYAFVGPVGSWSMLALLVAGVAAAWLLVDRAGSGATDRRPFLLVAIYLGLFFALPYHLWWPLSWAFVSVRTPFLAAVALVACVPSGRLAGRRAALLGVPLVAGCLAYTGAITVKFSHFDAELAGLYQMIDKLPYDPSVVVLIYDDDGRRHALAPVLRHVGGYVYVERGGLDPYTWGYDVPLARKPGLPRIATDINDASQFSYWNEGGQVEYYLTYKQRRARLPRGSLQVVDQAGEWELWQRKAKPQ